MVRTKIALIVGILVALLLMPIEAEEPSSVKKPSNEQPRINTDARSGDASFRQNLQRWHHLAPPEKEMLRQMHKSWKNLPPETRQKFAQNLNRLKKLPPKVKKRIAKLPAEIRKAVLRHLLSGQTPPHCRKERLRILLSMLRELTPEQKKHIADAPPHQRFQITKMYLTKKIMKSYSDSLSEEARKKFLEQPHELKVSQAVKWFKEQKLKNLKTEGR